MAKKKARKTTGTSPAAISQSELEVLKVLWSHGPGTVRQINKVLQRQRRRWAYTTVLTLLQRLVTKGCASSETDGPAHVFRAAVSRDGLLRHRLRELAESVTDGAASPLVQALVEEHAFTDEEIEHFRELLDKLDAGKRKPRK